MMKGGLRKYDFASATPMLSQACKLCEASFPNERAWLDHVNAAHGGKQRFRSTWLSLERLQPHRVSPQEQRALIADFAHRQQNATATRELEGYEEPQPLVEQQAQLWIFAHRTLAQ